MVARHAPFHVRTHAAMAPPCRRATPAVISRCRHLNNTHIRLPQPRSARRHSRCVHHSRAPVEGVTRQPVAVLTHSCEPHRQHLLRRYSPHPYRIWLSSCPPLASPSAAQAKRLRERRSAAPRARVHASASLGFGSPPPPTPIPSPSISHCLPPPRSPLAHLPQPHSMLPIEPLRWPLEREH